MAAKRATKAKKKSAGKKKSTPGKRKKKGSAKGQLALGLASEDDAIPVDAEEVSGDGGDDALGALEIIGTSSNGNGKSKRGKKAGRMDAQGMAKLQREISVSEFFTKNRHLLGFDNPRKALLTTIKEAVDNALDATEEGGILPEITVHIAEIAEDHYRITIQDNGPGIVAKQVPNVFGRLLYGSKFHRRRMSRGQQGIGISAACMYGQLTTGKPCTIISKPGKRKPATKFVMRIDTAKNQPKVLKQEEVEVAWDHGTRVEMEIEARYHRGHHSVDNYITETAIANPHATLHYTAPGQDAQHYLRSNDELPEQPKEIKPHPHGVELGITMRMLQMTKSRNIQGFLKAEFCRVSTKVAEDICNLAKISTKARPKSLKHEEVVRLHKAMNSDKIRIMAPPTNCVTPIGGDLLERSLQATVPADFFCAVTRTPTVYRGNPFLVEVGIAYGGELPSDKTINMYRYANRVPLLYQQGACAITDAVCKVDWKSYGLQQSRNNMPVGPAVVFVHMASVWVPFTSESKEAVASYPKIAKELRLGLQECGRKLQGFVNKRKKIAYEHKRRSIFERYIPEVARALNSLSGTPIQPTITSLNKIGSAYTAKADTMSEDVEQVSKGGRSRSLTRAAKPKGKKSTAANATATKKTKKKKAKRT
jgi:DNA topoisomerase-6 subunit B